MDSQESSPTPQFKSINSLALSFLHSPALTSIHDHWKNIALTRQTFVGKVMSLLLNMLFRLVITFLPSSRRLLISWLQSCVSLEFYNRRDNLEYTGKKAVTKRHSSQNYRYLSSQRKKKKRTEHHDLLDNIK